MSRSPTSSEPSRWRLRPSPWERPPSSWPRAARRPLAESLGLDPVWAQAQEAGIPSSSTSGARRLIDPPTSATACRPADFHGGEENFRSVDYMGIPGRRPDARHDDLRRRPRALLGAAHRGDRTRAIWVPSWLRQMESAFEAFARHEERSGPSRSGPPSMYADRCASRPTRPRTWAGSWRRPAPKWPCSPRLPHVEGGRRPLERSRPPRRRQRGGPPALLRRELLGSHGDRASVVAA